MSLTVLYPTLPNTVDQARLDQVLDRALAGREVRLVRRAEDLSQLQGERILFALSLDKAGQNFEYYRMLSRLRREPELLEGCTGCLVVDGPGELYTKSTAAACTGSCPRGTALSGHPAATPSCLWDVRQLAHAALRGGRWSASLHGTICRMPAYPRRGIAGTSLQGHRCRHRLPRPADPVRSGR